MSFYIAFFSLTLWHRLFYCQIQSNCQRFFFYSGIMGLFFQTNWSSWLEMSRQIFEDQEEFIKGIWERMTFGLAWFGGSQHIRIQGLFGFRCLHIFQFYVLLGCHCVSGNYWSLCEKGLIPKTRILVCYHNKILKPKKKSNTKDYIFWYNKRLAAFHHSNTAQNDSTII